MHFIPEILPLNEEPPSTEEEWTEALKFYGADRDDPRYRSTPSEKSRLCKHHRNLVPRRGMDGSDDSDADAEDPATSMRARKKCHFGTGGIISSPPVCNKGDEDQWDGAGERKRIREIYETEGWLHGMLPSFTTKRRRRRVIRRLGLAGNAEADHERRTIISHYMELTKLVDDVGFAILRDDVGYKYSIDPTSDPIIMSLSNTALSTFASHNHAECTAIGDMSRDWRTKGSKMINSMGNKFIAAAPLLYLRSDPPVAFGGLIIIGKEARTTFTEREQAILLNISAMLVYQLATFQSELVAEKASTMYEHSLSFLRRSVMPTSQLPLNDPTPRDKSRPDLKTRRHHKRQNPEKSTVESVADSIDELPPLVIKSGPKDQLDAKRRSQLHNSDLHQDAATTLRGILGADAVAMVDMEDYQLYYRRTGAESLELDSAVTDPANISPVMQFMAGDPWPESLLPIVHHVPTSMSAKSPLLAYSSANPDRPFDFSRTNTEGTLCELLVHYLQNRQFWWDRYGDENSLGGRLMSFCPSSVGTLLIHFMLTADGRVQHLMLATWDRPPSTFADSSALALPFVQILGGLSHAAINFRKARALEASQVSYSNLQAHELRTPLHQILAITQILRSTMLDLAETQPSCQSYVNSLQQIRDLIPMLDAIDTSGKTLHDITENILSFLDLKTKEAVTPSSNSHRAADTHDVPQKTLVDMMEDVVQQAHEDSERSRRSAMQSMNNIETIFEIDPPELGTDYTEDRDGNLRRALTKILSNSYKFIDGEGCVEIKLSNLAGQETLENCRNVCSSRKVMIEIRDNGPGMDAKFVRDHLGEPWAKQDAFTTGSGLSVHLAYRIIDMMGGHMEVHSAPGRGCLVRLEIPVSRKKAMVGLDSSIPIPNDVGLIKRKVAIVGFNISGREKTGLPRLGEVLREQYKSHAEVVDISEADLVIANGEVEEVVHGRHLMETTKAGEVVFLTMADHSPHPEVVAAAQKHSKVIRRIHKPITPSVIRQTLAPRPLRSHTQHVRYGSNGGDFRRVVSSSSSGAGNGFGSQPKTPPFPPRPSEDRTTSNGGWRPKGMGIEEAIANLSLGDYFSSTRRDDLKRTSSRGSTDEDTPITAHSSTFDYPSQLGTPESSNGPIEADAIPVESPLQELDETIKVLVVEDNTINRKIMVKILSKLPVEIVEAADGVQAIEQFSSMSGSIICLLDINMPRKDGFQACREMRELEKEDPNRVRAEIIAVTALSADEEKDRGWKAGFDEWAVKPCGKAKITALVEKARKKLLRIMDEPDPEMDRRYTI